MKLTYDNPAFDKGTVLSLPGIGEVENGKEVEVSPEQADAFEATMGVKLADAIKNDENFKGGKKPAPAKEEEEAAAAEEGGEG